MSKPERLSGVARVHAPGGCSTLVVAGSDPLLWRSTDGLELKLPDGAA